MTLAPLPYQALALDLDGTLLDPQGRISPLALRVLEELSERGLQIVLASGRMTARILPFGSELRIPLTLIAYNGAETLEGRANAWHSLGTRVISPRTRDIVFDLCRGGGVFLNIYSMRKLHGYHPSGDFAWSHLYRTQTGAEYSDMHRSLDTVPRDGIAKLLAIETPEKRDRLYQSWEAALSSHCSLVKSNPEYLEILDKGVSKGAALESWLATKGIGRDALIAFGDAENDLEMLRLAGTGIAMGNATSGLRAVHPRISPWTNAEDGVARELARLFYLSLV